jgi:hypothetical protein
MTLPALIDGTLALYRKHGWVLRQVLLTEKSRKILEGSPAALFGETETSVFQKDAAWFSRPSGKDGEAWEIRLFSETPYALIEVFGPDQDEREREEIRRGMEQKLLDADPLKMERKQPN